MAQFAKFTDGGYDDLVRLQVFGQDLSDPIGVKVAESYEVTRGFLRQPGDFKLRLGSAEVASELLTTVARPGNIFAITIGNSEVPQLTGEIDGFEAEASAGATEVTIHGRDAMALVHDAMCPVEKSFTNYSYNDLVHDALKQLAGIQNFNLDTDGASNRKITTGVNVRIKPGAAPGSLDATAFTVARKIHAKLGERVLQFLRRHLDRAGLFLIASPSGSGPSFVLCRPNTEQAPLYRIARHLEGGDDPGPSEISNIVSARWRVDTSHMYSEVAVYSRSGGRKAGRTKQRGDFDDVSMQAFGFNRPLVLRDKQTQTAEQAEFLARRHIAESNRQGRRLEYVMRGHSTPSLQGDGRAVWAPDTIVQVDDDEFGLSDNFWIESVTFRRNPQTTTTLSLMRTDDLIFGADD